MPILVSVQQSGLSGNHDLQQDGIALEVKRDFTVDYFVLAEENDTTQSVIKTPGIPQIGSSMHGLMCKKLSAKRERLTIIDGVTQSHWTVTAEYNSDFSEIDPTELPPEVSWSGELYEEVLREDIMQPQKKVVTKCGEPLVLTIQKVIPVLTIKRTEKAPFSPLKILRYTNTVNSGSFWGAPAQHAKLENISASYKQVEMLSGDKRWFVDVTYVIKFRYDPNTNNPWIARILHAGTKYFEKAGAEAQCWEDVNGNTGIINLDANGLKLPDNQPPVYLEFNVYKTQNWDDLQIDEKDIGSMFV